MTIFTKTHIAKAISIKNNDSTFNFLALFLIFYRFADFSNFCDRFHDETY